ncbi:uncharacterized protein VICG_00141 [Vittaforma corneae ATCC 50505]|uniref:Uncharacterized protein n=1 Tax=Vittaforma corneae (strain ATCC 50505) TaxID=993615 RepID=L2GPR0_VITCO|nr:uncharacterized protein VICG_00141 [Vittaforma corneae ATCC 50505]ELA42826.1 hypothetical protein VICG_00141 [Vittaforma corneae ATCC 50505]
MNYPNYQPYQQPNNPGYQGTAGYQQAVSPAPQMQPPSYPPPNYQQAVSQAPQMQPPSYQQAVSPAPQMQPPSYPPPPVQSAQDTSMPPQQMQPPSYPPPPAASPAPQYQQPLQVQAPLFQGLDPTLAKESVVNPYLAQKHFAFCSIFAAITVICACLATILFFFTFLCALQNLTYDLLSFNAFEGLPTEANELLVELFQVKWRDESSIFGDFKSENIKDGFIVQGFLLLIAGISYLIGLVIGWFIK